MHILLVEDEPAVASVIYKGLQESGNTVSIAPDGTLGFEMATANTFDVLVLDIMLPGINGVELCRKLRQRNIHTPILMLTALSSTENVVQGLDSGADDYLVKPFRLAELEARLRTLFRRANGINIPVSSKLILDDLELDETAKTVQRGADPVSLTATEYRLLQYLLKNKNRVLSRMEILEAVWSIDFNMSTNVVDVYINYLRKKTESNGKARLIHTVVGMGYVCKQDES